MIDYSYYEALRAEVCALTELGLQLQTVIAVALPAELHPKRQKNKNTGRWEPVLKNGQPVPAFVGKNPSCWQADGRPRTIYHPFVCTPCLSWAAATHVVGTQRHRSRSREQRGPEGNHGPVRSVVALGRSDACLVVVQLLAAGAGSQSELIGKFHRLFSK